LSGNIVEGPRVEYKEGWNPTAIMRTVCAFANDFENEGSGYIIIGVSEKDGNPIRPVKGIDKNIFEGIQKEMIRYGNFMQPTYFPRLSLEEVDQKHLIVIWVTAGTNRPYKVPDDITSKNKVYNYRIRQYSSSIIPKDEQEIELIQLTAKIPFDDRVNSFVNINELSKTLMRNHLEAINSKLLIESEHLNTIELAQKMNLSQGANEHLFPKVVGLLMFTSSPQKFYKGAKIDLVEFPEGLSGKSFSEKTFIGPIQQQLKDVLAYINKFIIKEKVIKYSDRAEVDKVLNYPFEAIEEALANAVYHKNYEIIEPIEVRILPNSIEIISYNGIDPSLKQDDFDKGVVRARRYRNSRIGEFLKELKLTEGKGTGIPTIMKVLEENGSPKAIFDTNEPERAYFISEFLIHPSFEIPNNTKNIKFINNIQINDHTRSILNFCDVPKSKMEIFNFIGLSNQTKNFNKHILPFIERKWLTYTIPEKPTDRNQKYIITENGKKILE